MSDSTSAPDELVERAARALWADNEDGDWEDGDLDSLLQYRRAARIAVESAAPRKAAAKDALILHMREWREDGSVICQQCGYVDDKPFGWIEHQVDVVLAAASEVCTSPRPYTDAAPRGRQFVNGYLMDGRTIDLIAEHASQCPDPEPHEVHWPDLKPGEGTPAVSVAGTYICPGVPPNGASRD